MSDNLYDALEECLSALRSGEDIEACLARYPSLAADLRPLLAAAAGAESLAVSAVPAEAARRGRARLLNQAAELRERAASPRPAPVVGVRFRRAFRLAVSVFAALLFAFMVGGVGLVFASSGSLPGDPLYRFKLSWEDMRLQWQTNAQAREALEDRFEEERVGEIDELLKLGRAEDVKFAGRLTGIFPSYIVVSNITVLVTPQTEIDGQLVLEAMVRVEGFTQADGNVVGTKIKVLGPQSQQEEGDEGGDDSDSGGNSGPSDGPDETQESQAEAESFELEGTLTSAGARKIVVAGRTVFLTSSTEIRGTLEPGATVRARGYIDSDGALIATRVEVRSGGVEGGEDDDETDATVTSSSGSDDGDGGDASEDDDGDDDHSGSQTPTPTPDG